MLILTVNENWNMVVRQISGRRGNARWVFVQWMAVRESGTEPPMGLAKGTTIHWTKDEADKGPKFASVG